MLKRSVFLLLCNVLSTNCSIVSTAYAFIGENTVDLVEHVIASTLLNPIVKMNVDISTRTVSNVNSSIFKRATVGFLTPSCIFFLEKTMRTASWLLLGKERFYEKVAFDYSCFLAGKTLEIFGFNIATAMTGPEEEDFLRKSENARTAKYQNLLAEKGDCLDLEVQKKCFAKAKEAIETDEYKKQLGYIQWKKNQAIRLFPFMKWFAYILQPGNMYSTKYFYEYGEKNTYFGKLFFNNNVGIRSILPRDRKIFFPLLQQLKNIFLTTGASFPDIAGDYKKEYDKLPQKSKKIDLIKIGIIPGIKSFLVITSPCYKLLLWWMLKNKFRLYAWPKIQSAALNIMNFAKFHIAQSKKAE